MYDFYRLFKMSDCGFHILKNLLFQRAKKPNIDNEPNKGKFQTIAFSMRKQSIQLTPFNIICIFVVCDKFCTKCTYLTEKTSIVCQFFAH